jgi:hypothetical protein
VPEARQRASEVGAISGTASPAREAREVRTAGTSPSRVLVMRAVPRQGRSTEAGDGNTVVTQRVRRREPRGFESAPQLTVLVHEHAAREPLT